MKCTAKRTNGELCNNWAIHGANVCRNHGGSAPQVKDAARRRLLEAVDPLMAELIRIALHGDSEAVRTTAIRDALDRAGYGAKQKLEQEVTVHSVDDAFEATVERLRAELAGRGESTPVGSDTPPTPDRT